jgi:hypothetical protein
MKFRRAVILTQSGVRVERLCDGGSIATIVVGISGDVIIVCGDDSPNGTMLPTTVRPVTVDDVFAINWERAS